MVHARVISSAVAAAFVLAGPLTTQAAAEAAVEKAAKAVEVQTTEAKVSTEPAASANSVDAAKPIEVAAAEVSAEPAAAPKKPAAPTLKVSISLTSQTMTVSENGETKYTWKISSGRKGYYTPTGTYRPQWMTRMHYSKKYDNAPMPHSVFFHGGYAIHATYATRALGNPASHGCIRLSPANAKKFYQLVSKHGKAQTRIAITGSTPATRAIAKRKKTQRKTYSSYVAPGNYWMGQPAAKPTKKYTYQYKKKTQRKPAPKTNYSYSYAQPKYRWPGD